MTALLRLLALALLICLALGSASANPAKKPAPAELLTLGGWFLAQPHPGDAALQEADEAEGPTETLTVAVPSQPFYQVQLVRGIPAAVPAGHRLEMRFQARSATHNPVRVTVEQSKPPYAAALELSLRLTPQWQEFVLNGVTPGYGPNGLNAHFQAGQQAGTVELRGVSVRDLGPDPALAEASAALTPQVIQARIRKYRMGTLTVHVVGSDGKPVRDAPIEIRQTQSAFLFGCNVFGYDPNDHSPAQAAYQDRFAALFNYATLPFYWGAFEPAPGQPQYARLQSMADWCVAHDITPKGHPLVWQQVWPSWAPSTPDAAVPLLHARVTDLITHYKTIHFWDVVNEANSAADFSPPNGESSWVKRDGPAPVVETALGWARTAGAGRAETFLYNDYNVGDANIALLTQLQHDGKLPDVIGLQSHMHSGVWPLTKIWTVCQQFAQFGRPIHFTETTVLSGPNRTVDMNGPYPTDWNTTPDGEAAQADYVANFYTILFSHPAVQAITWWDLSDHNAWLNAPAGLLRRDMTPKPAYTRLMQLIHKTWRTHLTASTNSQGTVTRRIFYGKYVITARDKRGQTETKTLFFPEAAGPRTVVIRLGS